MSDCLFCKISTKEITSEIIYENKDVLAFLDIHPRSPGHTMIIPRRHSNNMLELRVADLCSVFSAVQEVTRMLERALKPDGFTIGINHGRASGQVIDHLHVHVMPRFHNDGGLSIHSVVNNPPNEPLAKIAVQIRNSKSYKSSSAGRQAKQIPNAKTKILKVFKKIV